MTKKKISTDALPCVSIKKRFNSLIIKIKDYWWTFKLMLLKRQADKWTAKYGVQHFIVKLDGKVTIITKDWFKENRRKGKFPKHFTANNLKEVAYYYTTIGSDGRIQVYKNTTQRATGPVGRKVCIHQTCYHRHHPKGDYGRTGSKD